MNRFFTQLFELDREDSAGQRLYLKLLELFVLFYLCLWGIEWGLYMQHIEGVVHPLGIAQHLDISFLFRNQLSLVNAAVMIGSALLAFFRIAPRAGWTIALLSFHLHYAGRFCLGQIDHHPNFVGVTLVALTAGAWVSQTPVLRRQVSLGVMYFYIGLAYFLGGLSKLVAGGLTWSDGHHLWLWIMEKNIDNYSKFGTPEMTWIQELALSSRLIATLMLTGGLLIELGGVLLWWRRARPWAALGAISLHLGIAFAMNIRFDMFIYQLILIGFAWATLFDRQLLPRLPDRLREGIDRLCSRFA